MALVKVTDTNNNVITVDSVKISRIIDTGSSRTIWFGVGHTATNPTYIIIVKDNINELQFKTGLVKLLAVNNQYCLVNPSFVSFVDPAGSASRVRIGTCNVPSTSGTIIAVNEKVDSLIPKLGLLKVTITNNFPAGVNRNYVSRIIEKSGSRVIWFGVSEVNSVTTTKFAVKDALLTLQKAMRLAKVTTGANVFAAVNPSYVSSIQDIGVLRKIWMGVGNVAGIRASFVSAQETRSQLNALGIY